MDEIAFKIDEIYVPVKQRQELDPKQVAELAESILENGQQTPINLRQDGKRLVLVNGLNQLEACRALGEETVLGILVGARRY